MVRSSILNVTFDCSDAEVMSRFWSEVTRWPRSKVEMPGNPFWWVGPDSDALPHLVFVEVPEPKLTKNRLHSTSCPLTELKTTKSPGWSHWALGSSTTVGD